MNSRRIIVGTSGWMYKHWDSKFYPPTMKNEQKLEYYATAFPTVEINTTFYHFAKETSFAKWHEQTPKNFMFSVKINRRYTHIKRLIVDDEILKSLQIFFKSIQKLKEKLGVILIQLPESAKRNDERLDIFLKTCVAIIKKQKFKPKLAIEFRHSSWFEREVYDILKKWNVALVIANSSRYPYEIEITSDFSYLRFHGPANMFLGKYTQAQLKKWKKVMDGFPKKVKVIYAYFNNDEKANAIENAAYLKKIVEG